MLDRFNRNIDYLRISVTDKCNLRCIYCMPAEGIDLKPHDEILRFEEIEEIVKAAVTLGIQKIRLTGGEPLVRRGIIDFIDRLSQIEGIKDISLTTNGMLLGKYAAELKKAGLTRVNVSLDTLNPQAFREITRIGEWEEAWSGIMAAMEVGLNPVKLNVVVVRGVNDQEIADFATLTQKYPLHVRFIELMPIGECSPWSEDKFISLTEIKELIGQMGQLLPARPALGNGPAKYFTFADAPGTLGFISALSEHFCGECNRLRLTAEGQLRLCLHSDREIDLRTPLRSGASQEDMAAIIANAIGLKPNQHHMQEEKWADRARIMSQIGG